MEIQGKIAVVTGASAGIGRATALALAKAGADVVLAARDVTLLDEACRDIEALGRQAVAVRTDVSKIADVQNLFDVSIKKMGQVDILFNNAGVHLSGPVENMSLEDWRWIVDTNLWGVIHGVHVFLPHMLQRGTGYIVNTSSAGGLGGGLDPSIPYTTTKFAVVGLTEGLAVYLRDKGIGVSVLCPNYVATNMYFVGGRHVPATDPALNELWERFRNDPQRRDPAVMRENNVLPAEAVADQVVEAIKTNKYFILTHDFMQEMILTRAQDLDQYVETVAGWARERTERIKALLAGEQGTEGA